ncbi:unnamed protein product [Blepharisma stoltei]|uniref:Transmembrane protein 230 n=1 Tax=Blepharisma stoltei TaxID=1481888 RepID=A0AAU9IQ48_9CILI|nr:unnamed protein product [Blepharisma stoltei]
MDFKQPYFRKAYELTKSKREVNLNAEQLSNTSFELAPYSSTDIDLNDNNRWIYVIGVLGCLIGIVIISVGVLELVKDRNKTGMAYYWSSGVVFLSVGIGFLYKGIKAKYESLI